MRDLVLYHAARLPYDAQAVIADPDNPLRLRFLEESADQEAMLRSEAGVSKLPRYDRAGDRAPPAARARVCASRSRAVLRLARQHRRGEARGVARPSRGRLDAGRRRGAPAAVHRLARAYGNPRLTIADYGYLLDVHPLEIWCAGELIRTPGISFEDLTARADEATDVSSAWLFRDAQSQGTGSASQEAYRARRFRAYDALLAPDGIPVRAARSIADDRPRQLVGPAQPRWRS